MFRRIGSMVLGTGAMLHAADKAQGEWELANSRRVMGRRMMLLLLLMLPVVVLYPLVAHGATGGALPANLPSIGGSKALTPAVLNLGTAEGLKMFFGTILMGLVAGLITGVIGAGGGYILTLALMSFGVHGIMAVGTDQFHLFTKAAVGTVMHRKMGNVNIPLAIWFVLGSLGGIWGGGALSRAVYTHSPAASDAMISAVYVLVLGILGIYAITDYFRQRKGTAAAKTHSHTVATTRFAQWMQEIPLWPRIRFDQDVVEGGRSISVYPVILTGTLVGFVAAIMGVGGGLLTFPIFIYGLGVSTFTTVGTSILQILFTTSYSSIAQYAIYGYVFYSVCVAMLASLFAVQIGAMVTKVVTGSHIRAFYALTILAGFANRLCALPRKLAELGYVAVPETVTGPLEETGKWLFFGIVAFFSLWILWVFVVNFQTLRRASGFKPYVKGGDRVEEGRGMVVRPKMFAIGAIGLALCMYGIVWACMPLSDGRSPLERSDAMFNQIAKDAIGAKIPEAYKKAAEFEGRKIDLGIDLPSHVKPARIVEFLEERGVGATITEDQRVRITDDLGRVSKLALEDVKLAMEQRAGEDGMVKDKGTRENSYCWWIVYRGLTQRMVQEKHGLEGNFCDYMMTRHIEPAFNFDGIEAAPASKNWMWITALLGLYVLATVWYGVTQYWFTEGIGLSLSKAATKKAET